MRAVIYARYSSDNQRDASIDDQVRLCKVRLKHEGWALTATYSDRAISGAQVLRPRSRANSTRAEGAGSELPAALTLPPIGLFGV